MRIRTREWRAALRGQRRGCGAIGGVSTFPLRKNTVRAELYEVR